MKVLDVISAQTAETAKNMESILTLLEHDDLENARQFMDVIDRREAHQKEQLDKLGEHLTKDLDE